MALQRMDNVGIVVADLDAAIAFFVELGLELEGRAPIDGEWAARVTGLTGMRVEIGESGRQGRPMVVGILHCEFRRSCRKPRSDKPACLKKTIPGKQEVVFRYRKRKAIVQFVPNCHTDISSR